MRASELIVLLEEQIKKVGDKTVVVRGEGNGTFGSEVKVREGRSAITKNKICITGDHR